MKFVATSHALKSNNFMRHWESRNRDRPRRINPSRSDIKLPLLYSKWVTPPHAETIYKCQVGQIKFYIRLGSLCFWVKNKVAQNANRKMREYRYLIRVSYSLFCQIFWYAPPENLFGGILIRWQEFFSRSSEVSVSDYILIPPSRDVLESYAGGFERRLRVILLFEKSCDIKWTRLQRKRETMVICVEKTFTRLAGKDQKETQCVSAPSAAYTPNAILVYHSLH